MKYQPADTIINLCFSEVFRCRRPRLTTAIRRSSGGRCETLAEATEELLSDDRATMEIGGVG